MSDDHSSRRRFIGVTAATMASLAGCSGSDSPATSTDTQTTTATATPTTEEDSTASPTSSEAASPTDTQTPIKRDRDLDLVRQTIVRLINQHRDAVEKDLEPLETDTSLGQRLEQMAQKYSERLAEAGTVVHDLNGQSVKERYDVADLEGCRVPGPNNDRILPWKVLEVITRVDTYAKPEEEIAMAAVDAWKADYEANKSLLLTNASEIGVGVTLVSHRNEAYIVANLCS